MRLPYLISRRDRTTLFAKLQRALASASSSRATRCSSSSTSRSSTSRPRPQASIARTMLLPAAARHLALLLEAQLGELAGETSDLIAEFTEAIKKLESANLAENQPEELERARRVHARLGHPGDGRCPRRRRPAREGRRRRPVAAAEVLGDPVHQITSGLGQDHPPGTRNVTRGCPGGVSCPPLVARRAPPR